MNQMFAIDTRYLEDGHNGAGWYYWEGGHRDGDGVGAFSTADAAESHAMAQIVARATGSPHAKDSKQ